jgi:hypothetical protein
MSVNMRLNFGSDCGIVQWHIHYADIDIEMVEDRRDLLDPVSFKSYSKGTPNFGRRMAVR